MTDTGAESEPLEGKTEYMVCESSDSSTILIGPEPAVKPEKFRCLRFVMHEIGGILPGPNGGRSRVWSAIV